MNKTKQHEQTNNNWSLNDDQKRKRERKKRVEINELEGIQKMTTVKRK